MVRILSYFSRLACPNLRVHYSVAIERPDDIATRLVNAGHAPTMLNVEEEDLEHYFLRLVGMEEENRPRMQFGG